VIKALRGVGERIVIILIPTELWVQIVALFLKLGDSCPSAAAINRLCGPASPQNADGQLKKADRRSSKSQIVKIPLFLPLRVSQPSTTHLFLLVELRGLEPLAS
jgi:hypothetical protein